MHQTHDQQADPAFSVEDGEVEAVSKGDIRHQHHDGGEELQEGAVDPFYLFDKFIQQDDRCIQHCGAETEENADEVAAALREIAQTRDEHDAQSGHCEAKPLLPADALFEKDGAGDRHDDGGEIIAEGCHGNCGIAICLKQQDPVKAHCRAREEQQEDFFFDAAQVDLLLGDEQVTRQKYGSKDGSVKCQLSGTDGNVADEQSQRTEDCHGDDEQDPCVFRLIHNASRMIGFFDNIKRKQRESQTFLWGSAIDFYAEFR